MDQTPVHVCTPQCAPWHHTAPTSRKRLPWRTVDVHCHMFTALAEQLVADQPQKRAEADVLRRLQGDASVEHNDAVVWPRAIRKMSTLGERLADMDATGVDVQVVSPSPTQYYYWADEALAEAVVLAINSHIAEQCERHRDRLAPMGSVALQHPALAIKQLRHCVRELGMVGVEVSGSVGGFDLADPRFERFWSEAAALDCPVFIHPMGTSLGERVNEYYLANIIGQPLETTVALSKLILSGVLDRHPALKLIAAHGGGYLPSYVGRLDHGWSVRPEARTTPKLPSSYLRRIWFDSVVYSPGVLRQLIDTVGASQVMVGTDYPYDMGMDQVHEFFGQVAGLSEEDLQAMLGANAARLFKLPQTEVAP